MNNNEIYGVIMIKKKSKSMMVYFNQNNTQIVYRLSLTWFIIGTLLPLIMTILDNESDWNLGSIIILVIIFPIFLAVNLALDEYYLLSLLSLGLYIYPLLLMLGIFKDASQHKIDGIKFILSVLFFIVLLVLLTNFYIDNSNVDFLALTENVIHHSAYWVISSFIILPIYEIVKNYAFEIKYYIFIAIFFLVYSIFGVLQYQKYSLANDIEKEKYFSKYILYNYYFQPSGIEYKPLPEIKINYDTVVEFKEIPHQKDENIILQNYQTNGLFYQYYNICFFGDCPEIIKISNPKKPNYYLNIKTTNSKIDYELLDSRQKILWQASSFEIETYDKFYNKSLDFHPNYNNMIKDKFKLPHPLLAEHKDIIIHDNGYSRKISKEQRQQSETIKRQKLSEIFKKNSPFYKNDKNNLCNFKKQTNKIIKLNGSLFKHKNKDLSSYESWCSEYYDVLISTKESHIWDNEDIFLFDKKTNTPLLRLNEFAYILNKDIVPNKDALKADNQSKLLEKYPDGFRIKAISFKLVYYNDDDKEWKAVDDKANLPAKNSSYFWYALAVHTQFGDIFFRAI